MTIGSICFIRRYLYPVSSDGETQSLNPEVRNGGPRTSIVRDQVLALTTITSRLRSAFNGQDVDWLDAGKSARLPRLPLISENNKRIFIYIITCV